MQLLRPVLEHPACTAAASPQQWDRLVTLSSTYFDAICESTLTGDDRVRELFVGWLVYFWYLDNIVDEHLEELSIADMDNTCRAVLTIWDEGRVVRRPGESGTLTGSLVELGSIFLVRHLELLRELGLSAAEIRDYKRSVADHVRSQLHPDFVYSRVEKLSTYLQRRRQQGGMDCIIKLVLTLELRGIPERMRGVVDLANVSTALTNDLFSLDRDQACGTCNLADFLDEHEDGTIGAVCDYINEVNARLMFELECAEHDMDAEELEKGRRAVLDVVFGMIGWQLVEPRYHEGARRLLDFVGFSGKRETIRDGRGPSRRRADAEVANVKHYGAA